MKNQFNALLLTAALTGLIGGTVAAHAATPGTHGQGHHGQGGQGRPALHQPRQACQALL